jgi:branched-chain amino acid transport system substrate-binding protein
MGIDRRTFLEVTGASAAVAMVAGCSGDGDDGGDGTDGSDGGDGTDGSDGGDGTDGSDGGDGTDGSDGGDGTDGSDGDDGGTTDGGGSGISGPVTIGHLAPLNNPLGIGSTRSAEMAVASLREDGGIGGQEIELVTEDTRAAPSEARSVTQTLIREEEIDVLIGTFSSEVTQSIMDLVAEFKVPFLVTGSAAPSTITEFVKADYDRYKNTFRTGPINSNFQAEAMSQYAEHLSDTHGWNSFAFVADDAEWTTPFMSVLPGLLEDKGFEVPMQTALATDTTSFGSVLGNVAESGADSMFRFFAHINGGPMMGRWVQGQYEFGIEGIHVASMLPAWPQLTEGAGIYETTSQSGAGGVTEITPKTIPFKEAYASQFGDAENPPRGHPMYMGFNTYDAIHVWRDAAERAGTVDHENELDTIVDAMLGTDHTGVAGHVELYGPDAEYPHDVVEERGGDGTISNFPITQWRDEGALECVYPEQHKTADHVAPPWMS